ncbi:hypothetical protein [Parasedimentitalea huanghaiensis]|uniref:Glycosyltransferase family 10 (Fucosyltransferase) C-term n=1 Tax=Parasedimentitalea huanghaiensis TaxID=2682100 RepID=A0A6L6WK13_9RHOB|nr:hypothetical protein [Zongyanglinia huanghaiensis]MVO17518.1 hypothetical protein [Zongyanglinia huanghaiensis]
MSDPAIAVLPYGDHLDAGFGDRPLSELNWPLGCPERLHGKFVRDLASSDHLIVYPEKKTHFKLKWHCPAHVSMMVVEPNVIHGRHLQILRFSHRRFFRVFSYDQDFLSRIPNGIFLPFGTTWVSQWRDLDIKKTSNVSLIASDKRKYTGHKLRHELVDFVRAEHPEVEVMGRGYTPFENKWDGLVPFRYSVVIENVQQRNYFTEKLNDAILCECVPIYWGCPNIGDFMDTSGMVICNTEAEMREAIRSASPDDYLRRLPALKAIKETASEFGFLEERAAKELLASL